MSTEISHAEIQNNKNAQRFEAHVGSEMAIVAYEMRGDQIGFTHTEVPPPLEGKGLGNRLVHAALEYARENKLKIIPACPFVAVYIRRHPEYQTLVETE